MECHQLWCLSQIWVGVSLTSAGYYRTLLTRLRIVIASQVGVPNPKSLQTSWEDGWLVTCITIRAMTDVSIRCCGNTEERYQYGRRGTERDFKLCDNERTLVYKQVWGGVQLRALKTQGGPMWGLKGIWAHAAFRETQTAQQECWGREGGRNEDREKQKPDLQDSHVKKSGLYTHQTFTIACVQPLLFLPQD